MFSGHCKRIQSEKKRVQLTFATLGIFCGFSIVGIVGWMLVK